MVEAFTQAEKVSICAKMEYFGEESGAKVLEARSRSAAHAAPAAASGGELTPATLTFREWEV